MDYDLVLSCGILLAGCSVPAFLGMTDSRDGLKSGLATLVVAGALVVLAVAESPQTYQLERLPQTMTDVVVRYMPFSS